MIDLSDFRLYLPKYLSEESTNQIIDHLKGFPANINEIFYTGSRLDNEFIFQGDGISSLPYVELPSTDLISLKAVIISNTCDNDTDKKKFFKTRIVYCPLYSLEKYEKKLLIKEDPVKVKNHIDSIKKQRITQILYFPPSYEINEESFIFLDKVQSLAIDQNRVKQLSNNRFFRLSNSGFYIFLFKISLHFTRMQENIDRNIQIS